MGKYSQPRNPNGRPKMSEEERRHSFWSRVRVGTTDECWPWVGARRKTGYGVVVLEDNKTSTGAHRRAWEYTNGEIPVGLHVLHRCDNPPCVNPKHLFLGTDLDNQHDMLRKGRQGNKARPGTIAGASKLTWEQVEEIRSTSGRRLNLGEAQALQRKYGISETHLLRLRKGICWTEEGRALEHQMREKLSAKR